MALVNKKNGKNVINLPLTRENVDEIELLGFDDTPTDARAAGTLVFTANPSVGHSITLNGKVFRFGIELPILATVDETGTKAAEILNRDAGDFAQYSYVPETNTLHVGYYDHGAKGNAFTIASSNVNITASGATLTGGALSEQSSALKPYTRF